MDPDSQIFLQFSAVDVFCLDNSVPILTCTAGICVVVDVWQVSLSRVAVDMFCRDDSEDEVS